MTSDRRLHIAAAFTHALRALRELAIPIVIGVVAGGRSLGTGSLVVGLGGAAVSAVIGYVRWRTTTYRITGRALHFRSGVFSPDETVVPIDRIQSVDTIAGPIQRLFGITGLRVQTAGGGKDAEIALSALSPEAVRELREALGHREVSTAGAPRERLGARELALTALTAPQLTVLLPIVGLAGAAVQDGVVGLDAGRRLADRVDDPYHAAVALAVVLGVAWALSFAGAVLAFGGFEVTRLDDRLRVRRGLLERRAVSVPIGRVDAVVLVESVLRRPFGLATLRLEVAGLAAETAASRTLFPLLRRRDAEAFLQRLVPELAVTLVPERRPPRRALRRFLTVPVAAALILGVALTVAVPGAWPALPVALVVALVAGADAYAATGLTFTPTHVVVRSRRRGARVTLAARVRRLQEHGVARSPLQRRARLATVDLAVGSGTRARARHVEADVARAYLARLAPSGSRYR